MYVANSLIMYKIALIILFLTITNNGYSQTTDQLKLYGIEKSTMSYTVDTLTQSEFFKATESLRDPQLRNVFNEHIDSLKLKLKTLREGDSCVFIDNKSKTLQLCNKRGRTEKESEFYRFVGYECGYVIVLNGGYEWWKYILIEPITGNHYITFEKPIFIGCSYVYSFGNYYMEGAFKLNDLISNKSISYDSFNWILEKCLRSENSFYFEFSSNRNITNKKYLKLTFE